MKKGRHRRFEEARAFKRSHEVDLENLFETISDETQEGEHKPEHDAWADLAEEWEEQSAPEAVDQDETAEAETTAGTDDANEPVESGNDADELCGEEAAS